MTDIQLEGTLRSMGMACFVKYYEHFCDLSLSIEDIAQAMIDNHEGWTTILNRVSTGRSIIRNGRGKDALLLIVGSRADAGARRQAEQHLSAL